MTKSEMTNQEAAAVIGEKFGWSEIGRHFGIARTAVFQWKKRGVPLPRVNDMSKFTGVPVAAIIPETARHVSAVVGKDCSLILGELIKAFY